MKNTLYAFKWPLALLLIGFLIRILGAMMKILHWRGADETLVVATAIMVTAVLWLIIKLVLLKKQST